MAPNDVIPTRFCKIVLTSSLDYFIALITLTIQTGYFPNQFKQGIVRPLIKKSNIDPELLSSYRSVTNLRFLSKVIERVAFEQINYLESNNLMSKYQSAFRCSHSTETALLKVFNDLLCYLDESRAVMYIGLDLSERLILLIICFYWRYQQKGLVGNRWRYCLLKTIVRNKLA